MAGLGWRVFFLALGLGGMLGWSVWVFFMPGGRAVAVQVDDGDAPGVVDILGQRSAWFSFFGLLHHARAQDDHRRRASIFIPACAESLALTMGRHRELEIFRPVFSTTPKPPLPARSIPAAILKSSRGLRPPRKSQLCSSWPRSVALYGGTGLLDRP